MTKRVKRSVGISLICLCSIAAVGGIYNKHSQLYHTVDAAPSGLNVTLYNGQHSRGFSWWTEDRRAVDEQTHLYLSQEPFSEDDLDEARESDSNLKYQPIDGIYLIEGETKSVSDPTRAGRLLFVSYCSHKVSVDNLLAGQKYYYAVGGNEQYQYGEFKVSEDEETVVINFSDYQTNDGRKLHYGADTLSAAVASVNKPLDFFAFGGDFTSAFSLDGKQYNHFLGWIKSRETLAPYIGSTPLVMAAGNHDATNGLFSGNNAVDFDGLTNSGGYYSFDYNNIHFTVLNTNDFRDEQYRWLEEDLARVTANIDIDWRILMLHKGPYTTGDHGFEMEDAYIEKIASLCSTYHVDLVLQAHDHTYSKTLPYAWDSVGYTMNEKDESIIHQPEETVQTDGITCDLEPNGTYYISCGASGHRIGENTEYAQSNGERSYTNRQYKVAVSSVSVQSEYFDIGDAASADLGVTMFGVLSVDGRQLVYDFYAVDACEAVLIDRLAIAK